MNGIEGESGAVALRPMQQGLQELYELNLAYDVSDFLITSRAFALHADARTGTTPAREKLYVHEEPEGLNLSLYLDSGVVDNLERNDPGRRLGPANLEDFCLALEGISHFIYLAWNASHDREVTLLEMELQAEVDKFVMLTRYLVRQQATPAPGALMRLLFHTARYDGELDAEQAGRSGAGSRYAASYCRRLEAVFPGSGREPELLNELRRFYRMTQRGKLAHISRRY